MVSQTAPGKYWVQFTDKSQTPYSIAQPLDFLSQKALDRRSSQSIGINERYLPLDPDYINQVLDLGDASLVHSSKWFNAITIETADSLLIESIALLPFVSETRGVQSYRSRFAPENRTLGYPDILDPNIESSATYGPSFGQIGIHAGHLLHELGYRGEGMTIGVMDAGFSHAHELPIFDLLHNDGRILDTWDFVDGNEGVFHGSDHGMYVLSCLAGYMPDSLIGTAFKANYMLFRTEEAALENVVEEDNWIAAAEYADSAGVDVLNTSLGYSLFDDSTMNHVYDDMNGDVTRISQASDFAAARGMLVVTSAGNSGDSEWHYITAPADADSALTVGAIYTSGEHVWFSSFGPTSDGQVKPDVMAVGFDSVIADKDSTIRVGNGTSFSSPIMCGLVTCLWQAHKDKKNMDIVDAVQRSSSLYYFPNDSMGYGIPNLWNAHQILRSFPEDDPDPVVELYPNPFVHYLNVIITAEDPSSIRIELYDSAGRIVPIDGKMYRDGSSFVKRLDKEIDHLTPGYYLLSVEADGETTVKNLVKLE
jgi:hypothetical protein